MGQRRAVHAANRTCCHRARADIEPDLKVRAAMNEINAAQRLRHVPVHCTITALSMQDSAFVYDMPNGLQARDVGPRPDDSGRSPADARLAGSAQ